MRRETTRIDIVLLILFIIYLIYLTYSEISPHEKAEETTEDVVIEDTIASDTSPYSFDIDNIEETFFCFEDIIDPIYGDSSTSVYDIFMEFGEPNDFYYTDDLGGYYTINYDDVEFQLFNFENDNSLQYVGYIHILPNNSYDQMYDFYVGFPRSELSETIGNLKLYRANEYTDDIFDDNMVTYQIDNTDRFIKLRVDDSVVVDIEYFIPV